MSDETKLSRRGFLGMLAAIGAVPATVSGGEEVPLAGLEVQPEPAPPAGGGRHDTRLEYKEGGQWHRVGEVQSVVGPPINDADINS